MAEINMTEGNVRRTLLRFFLPLLAAGALQQLYLTADAAVIGRGIGDNALAAAGNTAAVNLFFTGFIQGMASGFSAVIAKYKGADDRQSLNRSVSLAIKICLSVPAVLSVLSLVFLRKIFALMHTDELFFADSIVYGGIIFSGLTAAAAYNMLSGILRAVGDSRTPLTAVIISSAVNILLDIFFISVIKTGVGGAAAATVFSQILSAAVCAIKLHRSEYFRREKRDGDYHGSGITAVLLKNGLPAAFMNALTAGGCIAAQTFVNGLGADASAAYSVCSRYLNLFMLPAVTMGAAVSAFAGQNLGAEKFGRIRQGVKTGAITLLIFFIPVGGGLLLFPEAFAGFMLSGEKAAGYACGYLRILGLTLWWLFLIFIFRSAVQGMGFPTMPVLSGYGEMAMRLAVLLLFIRRIGFSAAAYADAAAWAAALALNAAAYFRLMKRITPSDISRAARRE